MAFWCHLTVDTVMAMQRDWELIRRILFQTEERGGVLGFVTLELPEYTPEAVAYHVRLLHEQGLIVAQHHSTHSGISWDPSYLTAVGHDFLDLVRSDTVWSRARSAIGGSVKSASFELYKATVSAIAEGLVKAQLR